MAAVQPNQGYRGNPRWGVINHIFEIRLMCLYYSGTAPWKCLSCHITYSDVQSVTYLTLTHTTLKYFL